ncbi:MAG: cysteine--tRNA ligase [Candidatus Omnitrophica bacterium]|nr:cysteine--tRNA ligase [Candidatus Omnitrophota bacterium]
MSTLRVFNTLGQKKEAFKPLKEGEVRMYMCGVTVYDDCHLGHGRAYVSFDLIRRYLEYSGYRVQYIQNFTDIDDKIIKKAQEENKTIEDVARIYTEKYFSVMDRLNVKRASSYPKATEHIDEMVGAVKKLIKNGFAYEVDGDVYFRVKSWPSYGELSGRKLEGMRAGARVEVNERKEDPLDFALWKKAKEGEPSWPSPWGNGRPGWHIECSVMSAKYLGDVFDIHGGGIDLIFPHHENERAQTYGISGKRLANYWLHNGFITIDKEKMSKSLKNFFTLEDIFKRYEPEIVRYFLVSTHYRSPLDFNEEKLKEARASLDSFYQTFRQVKEIGKVLGDHCEQGSPSVIKQSQFKAAMDNDFNTSRALGIMHELSGDINQSVSRWYKEKKGGREILEKCDLLKEWGDVLGIFFKKEKIEDSGDVKRLIAEREKARKDKDWKKSDEIRKKLQEMGIVIEDSPAGTRWYGQRN